MSNGAPNETPQEPRKSILLELVFSEGGLATLVILPLVVLYYLTLALG